jgi:hypothetical protein
MCPNFPIFRIDADHCHPREQYEHFIILAKMHGLLKPELCRPIHFIRCMYVRPTIGKIDAWRIDSPTSGLDDTEMMSESNIYFFGVGGNSMSDGMLRVIGDQNKILLQSQMNQLREMKDMFNSVLKNSQNNQNPLAIIEQFKNAGVIPDPAKAGQAAPESIETINARMDAQVKLLTMKMEMEKTRHDWNIQREDKIAHQKTPKNG